MKGAQCAQSARSVHNMQSVLSVLSVLSVETVYPVCSRVPITPSPSSLRGGGPTTNMAGFARGMLPGSFHASGYQTVISATETMCHLFWCWFPLLRAAQQAICNISCVFEIRESRRIISPGS